MLWQDAVLGILRHALTTVGGGLVASGTLSAAQFETSIGAVMALVGIIWSVANKRKAAE